jgi:hypothetical protein
MDFAVVAVAFAAAGAALDRSRAARHLMVGFAMTIAALALQTAGRMLYFHDPLPNTYYLKLTGYPLGLRWARGAWVLLRSGLLSHGLPVLLPIAAIGISSGQTRRRLLAVLAPCAAMACYSVWVGGDAWEGVIPCNRYLAVALPLALAAGAWPLAALAARAGRFASVGAAILAVAAALAISPHRAVLLLDPPPYTRDNAELTSLGLAAKSLTRDEARVAAAAVGAIGYFSDRPIVDLLGKNDRHVAHRLMRRAGAQSPLTFFFPGHLKWDYPYSIGRLRPDVVAQLWWSVHEADPYLLDYEPIEVRVGDRTVRLAVRRDSRLVIWPAGVSRGQ